MMWNPNDVNPRHAHCHDSGDHEHTHGSVDPSIAASERGIWAVKWSFVGLFATALVQALVVVLSGSVALLSDTIHNFGDAATAVPLWFAFALSRLRASRRFPFGYGRVEDVAEVRARWLGHRLHAEVNVAVSPELSVAEGHAIAREVNHHLLHELAYLDKAVVHVDPVHESGEEHHRVAAHSHDDLPGDSH
jgi:divalent metal cation (Fe/Co/Zn/Cd) transporter